MLLSGANPFLAMPSVFVLDEADEGNRSIRLLLDLLRTHGAVRPQEANPRFCFVVFDHVFMKIKMTMPTFGVMDIVINMIIITLNAIFVRRGF
jgi:hypothetical protein